MDGRGAGAARGRTGTAGRRHGVVVQHVLHAVGQRQGPPPHDGRRDDPGKVCVVGVLPGAFLFVCVLPGAVLFVRVYFRVLSRLCATWVDVSRFAFEVHCVWGGSHTSALVGCNERVCDDSRAKSIITSLIIG